MSRLLLALLLAPAVAVAQSDASQRGSGTHAEPTATPGAGIESGDGNGLAGGRTDQGPTGSTGIDGTLGVSRERALARANDQARGENEKGSFLRPADTQAQMERHPHAIGSGAEEGGFPIGGRDYREEHAAAPRGKAGGIASGSGNPSGAAAQGTAGKSERTQKPAK